MGVNAQTFQFLLSQVRASGVVLSGGKVYFYAAGTQNLKTVWLDRGKTTEAANPYTLDANGTAQVFGDGLYDVVIKDASNVTKYEWENISIRDISGNVYDVADYASLAAAVASIGSTPATLQYATDQTTTANLVIPANVELLPLNGAKINHGAFTISYTGSTARWPLAQVFNGTGMVSGIHEAWADWFGDYSATVAPIQKAINSCNVVKLSKGFVPNVGLYVDKSKFTLKANKVAIDMSAAAFPFISLGVTEAGAISSSTTLDITIEDLTISSSVQYGIAGSHGVRFGRTAQAALVRPSIYGVQYGISSMTKDYSLGAVIENPDIRGNEYGIYDALGAFQGGSVIGGRIESNKFNGVYTKTDNWTISGTIIEGNGQGGTTIEDKAEIWAGQSAAITLNNVYSETIHSAQPIIYVPVGVAATQVHILGGFYYGKSGETLGVLIHSANATVEQFYSVAGANIRNMSKIVNVVTPNLGIYANLNIDDRTSTMDPANGLAGCTYVIWSKNKGFQANSFGSTSNYVNGVFATYLFARDFAHFQPVDPTTTTITNGSVFVDSTNANKLSYRDYSGVLHTITMSP